jgi:tetratricopeptide (TPR) repeat protein
MRVMKVSSRNLLCVLSAAVASMAVMPASVMSTPQPPAAAASGTQPPSPPAAGAPTVQDPAADLLQRAQQNEREGRPDEALALARRVLDASPQSFQANLQAGVALDLLGQYQEAREHFGKAIEVAASPQQKSQAQRSMAMSYAFTRDCKGAATYEAPVYERSLAEKNFFQAGEIADELARVCIDAGNLDEALKWYRTGREAGLREPDISPDRRDLWDFRWEHAQARIAARKGNAADARQHAAAAKAVLDKGTNPNQAEYLPYLDGYVALYTGDYKTAIAEFQKSNQRDPFILCLMAESYERMGDSAQAKEYYRKALAIANGHNPPNAYARPLAKGKIS